MFQRAVTHEDIVAGADRAYFDHLAGRELDVRAVDCLQRAGVNIRQPQVAFPKPERRAMSSADIAAGGSSAPAGFVPSAFVSMENASPLRRVATIHRIGSDTIDRTGQGSNSVAIPCVESEGVEGYEVPENTEQDGDSPIFGGLALSPTVFSSGNMFASNTMVRDGGEPFRTGLGTEGGKRLGVKENRVFTTAVLNTVAVNKTAASPTAITVDEIMDLIASTSAEMRAMPGVPMFMMHPDSYLALQKLKDNGIREWKNAGLDKYPVVENSMMPTIATGNKAVLFGNFSTVHIVETEEIHLVVMNEIRALLYQTGFRVQCYSAAGLIDRNGVELAALALG